MTQDRAKELETEFDEFLKSCKWDEERNSLNVDLKKYFNMYGRTFDDTQYIALVYLQGFEAITQGLIKPSNHLQHWVKKIDRGRSAKIIANLIAILLVSSLEDLIGELLDYGKNTTASFKNDYNILQNSVNKDLMYYLRPTAKKNFKWPLYLKRLFNIELAPFMEESLLDLLKARHDASHTDIDRQNDKNGEVLKLWALGARALLQKLTFSLQIRIKNERLS